MQEIRDPAITLFGMKIPFPAGEDSPAVTAGEPAVQVSESDVAVDDETEKDSQPPPVDSDAENDGETPADSGNVTPKTPPIDDETSPKSEKDGSGAGGEEKPALKKPDKILPCPRCNSMETKFCYYNNYNVNQPRHFCKACQRYWTAGGTMRNVPVGAGRRKNKTSAAAAAHYRHVTLPEPPGPPKVLNFELTRETGPGPGPSTGDECSTGSSVTDEPGRAVNVPCLPWAPYPPGFCQFYPYWSPVPTWTVPWYPAPKRSRVDPDSDSGRPGPPVLVPKTLRIDDPSEAAKSSIWATLGIKNEAASMLKAFESKSDKAKTNKSAAIEPSLALRANPAALSRSLNFHETS